MNDGLTAQDALLSGMAGAAALTAVHQAARMVSDHAPRMDVVGMRAIARGREAAAMAYYSLATTWGRGAALGLLAGIGALMLPKRMGLGDPPGSEHVSNQIMTVAWYVVGGLAAAWTAQCLAERHGEHAREFVGGY